MKANELDSLNWELHFDNFSIQSWMHSAFFFLITMKRPRNYMTSNHVFKNMPVFFCDKGHINFCCELNLKDEMPEFDFFFPLVN